MMAYPSYTRALVDRRNRGIPTDSVFISVGWPSQWLRGFVDKSTLAANAALLAAPDRDLEYDFSACVGLSCCIWYERPKDAPRAAEIAAMVLRANPLRLFTTFPEAGETVFYKLAPEQTEVAA